jgi:hypothetical protein
MKFAEPRPTRLLIEEDYYTLREALSIITEYINNTTELTSSDKAPIIRFAKSIDNRLRETTPNYQGEKYHIFLRGKRKLGLWFRREPDVFVGSEFGLNFFDACRFHFSCLRNSDSTHYNVKKNTFFGRQLLQGPFPGAYEAGIKAKSLKEHAVWFKLSGHTFTLESTETKNLAETKLKELTHVLDDYLYHNS